MIKLTRSSPGLHLLGMRLQNHMARKPETTIVELRDVVLREAKRCGLAVSVEGTIRREGASVALDDWRFVLEESLS